MQHVVLTLLTCCWQAATNTKQFADRAGDAAVSAAKEIQPKIVPAADRLTEQAEAAAHRIAEEGPQRIDKASEVCFPAVFLVEWVSKVRR